MRLYRLTLPKCRDSALSGEGALRVGGRWTPAGFPAVYASSSIALAALETLVHAPSPVTPPHWVTMIDMGDSMPITTIGADSLPDDWRYTPAPPALRAMGKAWLHADETAILRVPSAIVPPEWNYILNPLHTAFGQLTIHESGPFEIDIRLFRSTR